MPFTFAHPAIVLPVKKIFKRYVSTTGLVVGSIVPDFEYFFRLEPISFFSHTLKGTLYFNLPLAILLSFLFHILIRNPVIDHLPKGLYYRFHLYKKFDWVNYVRHNYLIVIASIIVGALSHIFWDSFTHPGGFFVRLLPELNHKALQFPLYRLVQHGSTVLGFAYIAWYILQKKKVYAERPTSFMGTYWLGVGGVTIGLMAFQVFSGLFQLKLGMLVVAIINGVMLGLFISSLVYARMNRTS